MNRPGIEELIVLIWLQNFALMQYGPYYFSIRKESGKHRTVQLAAATLGSLVVFLLCRFVHDTHMLFPFIYTILVQFVICRILFAGNLYEQIFYILFTNVFYSIILMNSIMVARFCYPAVDQYFTLYQLKILGNIAFLFLAFAILYLLARVARRTPVYLHLPGPIWGMGYIIWIFMYFLLMYVTDLVSERDIISNYTLLYDLGLLILCIAVYGGFVMLNRGYQENIQHIMAMQQYKIQKTHLEESIHNTNEIRKLRHELKNQIFYMDYLLDRKDYDGLEQYFREFYEKEYETLSGADTATSAVEAVLRQKMGMARKQHIQVNCKIPPYTLQDVTEWDMCILLSNLMDNAIEEGQKTEDAFINITIRQVKVYLSIVVENKASRNVLKENPRLDSSKLQKEMHGIGLKVIREIVKKYNGMIRFEGDEGVFTVHLMLENQMPKTKQEEKTDDPHCRM